MQQTNKIQFNDQIDSTLKENHMRSIGYDLKNNSIFWINNENNEYYHIHFGQLNNNSYGIIKSEINNTIKLKNEESHISWIFKYDWIHNLVYFKFLHYIYAQHINQFNFEYKYQILYTPQHIFDLTLDPINSLIFWSEGHI